MNYCSGPFGMVPHAVIDAGMSPYAVAVYAHLARYADRQTGRCYPGLRRLAKEGIMHVATVRKALKELEARGFIGICRGARGQGQSYDLSVTPHNTVVSSSVTSQQRGVTPERSEACYSVAQNENQLTRVNKREKNRRDEFGYQQDRTPTPSCYYCESELGARAVRGEDGFNYCDNKCMYSRKYGAAVSHGEVRQ